LPTCYQRDNFENTFNHNEHKYHEPESTKVSRNKSVVHNLKYKQRGIKTFTCPEIEKIIGKKQVTKIKEVLDVQLPLFTTEDKRLKYLENQYGLFSPNSWYNKGTSNIKLRKTLKAKKNKAQTRNN